MTEETFRVGLGCADITAWEPEMSMLGWGVLDNRIRDAATPMLARAIVFEKGEQRFAYCCLDLCFITSALQQGVIAALEREHRSLGLGAHNTMLTATHTHSGASGFCHSPMFNITNYGFSPFVYTRLVDGIVEAISQAAEALEIATLRLGSTQIPLHEALSFNRALLPYLSNPEYAAQMPCSREEATDRQSITLRIDDAKGRCFGILNWFGVHCTNIHGDNDLLHADNKGMAALHFERIHREDPRFRPDLKAIFAQAAAGDLQPNFRWSRKRKRLIGAYDDDHQSASEHGEKQAYYALKAWEDAAHQTPLQGAISALASIEDLGEIKLPPQMPHYPMRQTERGLLGLRQAAGTAEGAGPLRPIRHLLTLWARWRRWRRPHRDPKPPFVEIGRGMAGRCLGFLPIHRVVSLLRRVEPMMGFLHGAYQAGTLHKTEPWIPQRLMIQIAQIGDLALVGLPGEPTLTVGRRLHAALTPILQKKHLIIQGYTANYAGYICTPEEYLCQAYEGATTYFGLWTYDAYAMLLTNLAHTLQQQAAQASQAANPPSPFAPPLGHPPDLFDPARLIAQRLSGRAKLRLPGASLTITPPAHLRHLLPFASDTALLEEKIAGNSDRFVVALPPHPHKGAMPP